VALNNMAGSYIVERNVQMAGATLTTGSATTHLPARAPSRRPWAGR
jgi:hypothetical protein